MGNQPRFGRSGKIGRARLTDNNDNFTNDPLRLSTTKQDLTTEKLNFTKQGGYKTISCFFGGIFLF
jgi:hypothetical protein